MQTTQHRMLGGLVAVQDAQMHIQRHHREQHEAHQEAVALSEALLLQQAQPLLLCQLLCFGCCVLPPLLQTPIYTSVVIQVLRIWATPSVS